MNGNRPDPRIDSRLREVPLPDGFLQRLRDCIAPTDDELDQELCNVSVPVDLTEELRSVAADAILDEQIRDVDVPNRAIARLRVIPELRERSYVGQLAVAAGWLLIVGLGYTVGMYTVFDSVIPQPHAPETLQLVYEGPLELDAAPQSVVVELESSTPAPVEQVATELTWWPEEVELMAEVDRSHGPAGELLEELRGGMDPWKDTLLIRWGVVGYPSFTDDKLPDLQRVSPMVRRGMETPILPGYDRQFLFTKGTHPEVILQASHPQLQVVTPPLSVRTDSFHLVEDKLRHDGRLGNSTKVHVEDFLAAMDYGFRDPGVGELGMTVNTGPSLFATPGASMLHLGVKAGRAPLLETEKTHLTIALDISASMRWDQRLSRCQTAIEKLAQHVRNADRVSLVLFNEEVLTVADAAGVRDLPKLVELVNSLEPRGGTNVMAALQTAVSHAKDAVAGIRYRREVVMITDDQVSPVSGEALRIHSLIREAGESGVRLSVVDLDGQTTNSFLHDLAVDSAGELLAAGDGDELGWELTKVLLGQQPVVAEDAEATIHFNPKSVVAYRLIGHESTSLGGTLPLEPKATLRLGETATLLFEVAINNEDTSEVAIVELKWTDPRTGELRRRRQSIKRQDFLKGVGVNGRTVADAFFGGNEALQRAAFAAEVAEVLRQSPFVTTKTRGLNHVKRAAANMSGHLRQAPDVVRLLELVDRAR